MLNKLEDNLNFGGFDKKSISHAEYFKKLPCSRWLLKDILINNLETLLHFNARDKKEDKSEQLVFEIFQQTIENNETIKLPRTGNFIGFFAIKNVNIEITSRFSDVLLKRMLDVANNVFIQDATFNANPTNTKSGLVKYILGHLFIQKLEKAFILGFPKAYKKVEYHEAKIHGNIDFNHFIKFDNPFKGKISSVTREQLFVPEIANIIYGTIEFLEKEFSKDITGRLGSIRSFLKQQQTGKLVDTFFIDKALNHKSLENPIYASYKEVLRYSKLLLKLQDLDPNNSKSQAQHSAYLIDISELWELYLSNLLTNGLSETDWRVETQYPVIVYDKPIFYNREIRPDIVLFNNRTNEVAVFEAKYKRMNMKTGGGDGNYGDLDRSDFFQIHTYMSYFNKNKNLVAGGLLYPLNTKLIKEKTYAESWLGGEGKFVVDGIDLSEFENNTNDNIDELVKKENDFIKRMIEILK
jgi:5-methylcytosine-specific restriction endonuclease McrBC regulatory subunit McrC